MGAGGGGALMHTGDVQTMQHKKIRREWLREEKFHYKIIFAVQNYCSTKKKLEKIKSVIQQMTNSTLIFRMVDMIQFRKEKYWRKHRKC